MLKKITTVAVAIVVLAALTGLAYFFIAPQKTATIENSNTNAQSAPEIKSFRGALADVLKDIQEEASAVGEKVAETATDIFSEKEKEANTEENTFSFAVLGDTQYFTAGNSRGNFQKAVAGISKFNPDLVLQTGDLIRGCEGKSSDARDYASWKNIFGSLAAKTYAVQGNHDRVSDGAACDQIWQNAFSFPTNGPAGFSELVYSLDFKNSHFVFLDSDKPDGHQINDAQRSWLEKDLAATQKENTFVIFHEPAYPVSDKKTESLDASPSERNALWTILDKYNVTAIFNGHEHIVSRRKIDSKVFPGAKNSIYQFVFGNTDSFNHGLPAKGIAEYSNQGQGRFGLVKVSGQEITVETHGPDGALLNTFTFSK